VLDEHLLSGRRSALHTVHHDHVGTRFDGQFDVVAHARGSNFDVDRNLPIGDFP